jgi:isoquinoline 1-oxidoreductase beta subunit
MHATIDHNAKRITHWAHKIVSPSISTAHIPYNIPSQSIKAVAIKTAVPLGPWRSVDNSINIYAVESFIDEIARELSIDPVELRLSLLDGEPRLKQALIEASRHARAVKRSNSVLGCAVFKGYGSFIALLTEIEQGQNTPFQIIRMTACVDCGLVIDPDQARAQIEGGVIFALTAAIKSKIEIKQGGVIQGNFNDFPLLTLKETPEIDIILIPSHEQPGGLGEVPVPPVAPSIHNALSAFQH